LVILELARKYKVQDIVYASSSSVYGNNKKIPFAETDRVDTPISLYAATKKANELMAHTYHHLFGLNLVGLRFFTVYGPWGRPDMALFSFTENIAQGKEIQLFNKGNMLRDFTYIEDIVDGVVRALERVATIKHAVINLGNNKPEKLSKFVALIEKALGKTAQKKLLPMQPGDLQVTRASVTKAQKLLGYLPKTKLEKGIPQFVTWWQTQSKLYKL
jgi:UDP-glucuronate 4-epimerase